MPKTGILRGLQDVNCGAHTERTIKPHSEVLASGAATLSPVRGTATEVPRSSTTSAEISGSLPIRDIIQSTP